VFAPSWIRLPESDHTLFDAFVFPVQLVRHPTVERLEPGIALLVESGFPIVTALKKAGTDSRFLAKQLQLGAEPVEFRLRQHTLR